MMQHHPITSIADGLTELAVTPQMPEADGMNGVRVLGSFNGCLIGLVSFSGQTAWERHPGGEELLYIIEGSTEISQLGPGGRTAVVAGKGDVLQIPPNVWHSQRTLSPVKLLFITPAEGTEHSANPSRSIVV